jgi:outer membrane receptor protein involved in Fe transport
VRALPRLLPLLAALFVPATGGAHAQEGGGPPAQQEGGAILVGRVLDGESGDPLEGVLVSVEGTRLQTVTNARGNYRLGGVPPGPRVLRVERLGHATARIELTVPPRGVLRRDVELTQSALELEALVVTADPVSRAEGELGTASVIAEDAIEHQTSTSLAGVLELVPGAELAPPGLGGVEQVSLRAIQTSGASSQQFSSGPSASQLASFGTLIILDGVPLSNNANLQAVGSAGSVGELSFTSTAGGGIDLRRIPAATIERVEVIRGVPSARWGDLTQGAIVVETRAGVFPSTLRGQYDARTSEGSGVGGFRVLERGDVTQTAAVTIDAARTRSQPGLSDDHALRYAGQLSHRYASDRLTADTRMDGFQLLDDRPENENVRPGYAHSSRDRGLRVSERAELDLGPETRLQFTGAYSVLQQRSTFTAERVRGAMPFTDRVEPGRAEGFFVLGRYQADGTIDGAPHMLYSRLEAEAERAWLGLDHELRAGLEVRREWNSGPGYQFDIARPPQVNFNGVEGFVRPRSYDDIPALATSAAYVDERLRARLWGDALLQLQAGLRLDLLHPGGFSAGVRDDMLQPRVQAELAPVPWLRLRGGWGRTAKTPALLMLFPAPQYHDVINVNYYAEDPAERLAVLTTYVLDPTNQALGFARATKAEAGVEIGAGGAIVSLTAFRDEIAGAAGIRQEPTHILRHHYELTDSVLGNAVPPEIIEPPSYTDTVPVLLATPDNHVSLESRGLELVAFLPEIRPLRTRLQIQGAWIRTERATGALDFGTRADFTDFQLLESIDRMPYWEGSHDRSEQALLTYRVIHHQPELGLVLTATIQHNVFDRTENLARGDTLAWAGYVTEAGRLVPVAEADRTAPEFADLRDTRPGTGPAREAGADWFMSVQASKALPLGGELRFWAFNALDRPGRSVIGELPRGYSPMRFGLELSMPGESLVGWL